MACIAAQQLQFERLDVLVAQGVVADIIDFDLAAEVVVTLIEDESCGRRSCSKAKKAANFGLLSYPDVIKGFRWKEGGLGYDEVSLGEKGRDAGSLCLDHRLELVVNHQHCAFVTWVEPHGGRQPVWQLD